MSLETSLSRDRNQVLGLHDWQLSMKTDNILGIILNWSFLPHIATNSLRKELSCCLSRYTSTNDNLAGLMHCVCCTIWNVFSISGSKPWILTGRWDFSVNGCALFCKLPFGACAKSDEFGKNRPEFQFNDIWITQGFLNLLWKSLFLVVQNISNCLNQVNMQCEIREVWAAFPCWR